MCNKQILGSVLIAFGFFSAYAQENKKEQEKDTIELSQVVISAKHMLGSKFEARNRTGSAYFISPAEIQKMAYTDINRMLKAVPGVNIYEEDGHGLRPNISLRGTKAERSEKITLMEDGILAAPAPYSAPAAYYFPNAGRMSAVEVLKGSSQVQYGPFTTGGAINMVSTPIPNKLSGKANLSYGSFNSFKSHINVGDRQKHFGYLVEYLRYQSDGFKKFENSDKAGFVRNDVIAKFMVGTNKEEGTNHSLELKFGFANENSDETYVGLSAEDFRRTPFLRYAGSQVDNMKTKHQQWVATYLLSFSPKFKITTNAYYNHFHRNWYKLNDVKAGVTSAEKRSINAVLRDPKTNHLYFDILTGETDYIGEGLIVRANNRSYYSKGIQTKLDYHFRLGEWFADLEAGLRLHSDAEDRFQWDDSYSIENKKMALFLAGIHGSQSNRITSADALASYLFGKAVYGKWTITGGLRYEDVSLLKRDYSKSDVRRSGKVRRETTNSAKVFIPSLGVHYKITPSLSMFSGIHKGFSPPSAGTNQKHESSVNYELGTRLNTNNLKVELIGFFNRYSNMLGSDLAAAGGTGTLELFDIGEALVKGAEFLLHYQPIPSDYEFKLPIQITYTYTDTELLNTFEERTWGQVFAGDEIPYINKHSLNASVGAEYKGFELNVGVRFNGDMRTAPGQGFIAEQHKVPSHTIIDASVKARVNDYISLTINAVNITNKIYLVSRHPSGLRPGHPFGVYGGVNLKF